MRKFLLVLLFPCLAFAQVTEIEQGGAVKISFQYQFQTTQGVVLPQSDIVFDFAVRQMRDDAFVDSVSSQNYVVVGDTIKIDNFSLTLGEGEFYLLGYARRLKNGKSSAPARSNDFVVVDTAVPAQMFNVIVEKVQVQ